MKKDIFSVSIAILAGIVSTSALANVAYPTEQEINKINADLPSTFKNLVSNRETVVNVFDAGKGFSGYVIETPQQEAIIYHNEELGVAFSGMMLESGGINLSSEHYENQIPQKDFSNALSALSQDNTHMTEGEMDADKELWIFFDPNCPHCNATWQTSRSFIESGELKVHWVPVAFLSNTSVGKVAKFWQSENRIESFNESELIYDQGGADPLRSNEITDETRAMLDKNLDYMRSFDANGTPTIIYETSDGTVNKISTSLNNNSMRELLNSM